MKKIFTLIAGIMLSASVFAQVPEKMSYQAVVRDGSNALVASTAVGMQISILQGSTSGTAVYVETQTPTSNANGLVSVEIGAGTVVSGSFSNIDWGNDTYFIKTETDPTGGTTYTITGTSQLLSVPYALYAETAEFAINDMVNDGDTSATNEFQTLSISNDTIFLSNGGNILIPNSSSSSNASQFDFSLPFGKYTGRVFVSMGQTINAPTGKILRDGGFFDYTYTFTASQDTFIQVYNDNPNITWITHDLSINDYIVPTSKIFVSEMTAWCTDINSNTVWTMANNTEGLEHTIGYVYPPATTISFDPTNCISPPTSTILTGYLIDEF